MFETEKEVERVILVAVDDGTNEFDAESCLDELEDLANTADAVVVGRMIQKLGAINRATYLGSGKIDELKAFAEMKDATGVICDDELSPVQIRNLENALNLKVMSRTLVILDIFAKRAMSAEGKVQVELAQLRYNLSHLTGRGKEILVKIIGQVQDIILYLPAAQPPIGLNGFMKSIQSNGRQAPILKPAGPLTDYQVKRPAVDTVLYIGPSHFGLPQVLHKVFINIRKPNALDSLKPFVG